jgi:hypothetical protein
VLLGEAPVRSPSLENYPAADAEIVELAAKMWGSDATVHDRVYGKGRILSGMSIESALSLIDVIPDVALDEAPILYSHRSDGDREIYFLSNQSESVVQFSPEFRVTGKSPELWTAVDGKVRPLLSYESRESSTVVPLRLEAYESVFVVFARGGKSSNVDAQSNFPASVAIAEVTSPWRVTFESDSIKRGPAEPVIFDRLTSWTEHPDVRIRYYSGTATYENVFTLVEKPAVKLYVDLGKVGMMAKVKINGAYAGGVFCPPYRIEVTDLVQAGENTIEVEVVNTWVNRLIGDSFLPVEQRIVTALYDPWKPTSALRESGLIGTVKIVM